MVEKKRGALLFKKRRGWGSPEFIRSFGVVLTPKSSMADLNQTAGSGGFRR